MDILIIGSGALGIGIGASLLAAGHGVSFLARSKTAQAIKDGGVHRVGLFQYLHFAPGAAACYTDYPELPDQAFDFVLICSKSTANDDISAKLAANRRVFKADGRIVIMQNGWGNDRPYLRFFTQEQLFAARVITGFRRSQPNVSEVTVYTEPILLGSLFDNDLDPLQPLAQAITDSGIFCEVNSQISKALWAKMLYNCSLNPLGAILNVHYGKLMEDAYSRAVMDEIMDEIFAVMHAAGYQTFWPDAAAYRQLFYDKLVPDTYNHRSSTLQDIEKKQKTEIDTLTGCIIRLGEQYGVPTPCNRTIYRQIKFIEDNF